MDTSPRTVEVAAKMLQTIPATVCANARKKLKAIVCTIKHSICTGIAIAILHHKSVCQLSITDQGQIKSNSLRWGGGARKESGHSERLEGEI